MNFKVQDNFLSHTEILIKIKIKSLQRMNVFVKTCIRQCHRHHHDFVKALECGVGYYQITEQLHCH